MGLTTDRDNPCLQQIDSSGMQACYLVLSEEERAEGFVRPVRRSYMHVGIPGPKYELRDLTDEENERFRQFDYVKFEVYPKDGSSVVGKFWTQKELDKIDQGCGAVTTMAQGIAETYARDPKFYGGTYCVGCRSHLRVGEHGEFVWIDETTGQVTDERVGT